MWEKILVVATKYKEIHILGKILGLQLNIKTIYILGQILGVLKLNITKITDWIIELQS